MEMRIDKFLKVSRLIKRRSVAADACGTSRVYLNGRPAKPAARVKIGDEIRIEFGASVLHAVIKSLNEKVSKEEASALYEIIG